jgi:hypothetical protein
MHCVDVGKSRRSSYEGCPLSKLCGCRVGCLKLGIFWQCSCECRTLLLHGLDLSKVRVQLPWRTCLCICVPILASIIWRVANLEACILICPKYVDMATH